MRIILLVLAMAVPTASAEVLFEAFYKIEQGGQHMGYMVQRVARDGNKRTITSYMRVRQGEGEVYQTSRSISREPSLSPLESVHSTNTYGTPLHTKAKFSKNKVNVRYTRAGAKKPFKTETIKLAPGVIANSFLYQQCDCANLKPATDYWYTAFMEDRGQVTTGILSKVETFENSGLTLHHLINDYSGVPSEVFVGGDGHVVAARNPGNGLIVYWVRTKDQAVGSMAYPTNEFTQIFGELPEGKKNPWFAVRNFDAKTMVESRPKASPRKLSSAEGKLKGSKPLPVRRKR